MNEDPTSLDELRSEIDTVDDSIHDLLKKRANLVQQIGVLKNSQQTNIFRPSREAFLLRRLLAQNSGNFSATSLIRVWKEIIGASTQMQGGLIIAYCPINDSLNANQLVREGFGSSVSVVHFQSPDEVIQSVIKGDVSLGLVPFPRQDDELPWWPLLHSSKKEELAQVVSCVPFVMSNRDLNIRGIEAFVISRNQAESSSDDRSLIVFEFKNPMQKSSISDALTMRGLDHGSIISCRDTVGAGNYLYLADISGDIYLDEFQLENTKLDLSALSLRRLGLYASPVFVTG